MERYPTARVAILIAAAAIPLACDQSPTSPAEVTALSSAVVTRTAAPWALLMFNPCVPELVDMSGTVTVKTTLATDNIDGSHLGIHVNLSGQGTGRLTGISYRRHSEQNNLVHFNQGGSSVYRIGVRDRMISSGPGDNWHYEIVVQFIVSAGGEVTVSRVDPGSSTCRG